MQGGRMMAKYTRQDIVDLIDDEDIEFMQHEFISYRQAMENSFISWSIRNITDRLPISS